MKYLFRMLCVVFIAQISHYGKFTTLHKIISIIWQFANQINKKIPAKSCGARAIFLKLLWGRGWASELLCFFMNRDSNVALVLLNTYKHCDIETLFIFKLLDLSSLLPPVLFYGRRPPINLATWTFFKLLSSRNITSVTFN